MRKHSSGIPKPQGQVDAEYKEACRLVMAATDRVMAFDDYVQVVDAFGINAGFTVDGATRSSLEHRNNPFGEWAAEQLLGLALSLADQHGVTLAQLSTFFFHCGPLTAHQALCVVEDAVIILNQYPEMEDAQ